MDWLPFELHSHTNHTDGVFLPEELPSRAEACGLRGLALTDHNTTSCYKAFDEGLRRAPKFIGIHGMEWTTYFGHMLVLGEQGFTEWRGVQPHQIDTAIKSVHAHGGLVGMAHPYALSNPIRTGYRWRFLPQRWEAIDFIEVWSKDAAPSRIQSHNAFALWDAMLRQGYRIAATSGRDWHRPDDKPKPYCVTYLGLPQAEQNEAGALRAIRSGRICVTAGPLFTAHMMQDGRDVYPGDALRAGTAKLTVSLRPAKERGKQQCFSIIPKQWRVIAGGTCILAQACETESEVVLDLPQGWLRIELFGDYLNTPNTRIAFTNPFYVEE